MSRKLLQLALLWGAALGLSGLLVWSGRHWSQPLLHQAWALEHPAAPGWLALALVFLPPAGMALVLLRGLGAANHDRGESSD